jgi:hypothetical protein
VTVRSALEALTSVVPPATKASRRSPGKRRLAGSQASWRRCSNGPWGAQLGRRLDPRDLQRDRIYAPHAMPSPSASYLPSGTPLSTNARPADASLGEVQLITAALGALPRALSSVERSSGNSRATDACRPSRASLRTSWSSRRKSNRQSGV